MRRLLVAAKRVFGSHIAPSPGVDLLLSINYLSLINTITRNQHELNRRFMIMLVEKDESSDEKKKSCADSFISFGRRCVDEPMCSISFRFTC